MIMIQISNKDSILIKIINKNITRKVKDLRLIAVYTWFAYSKNNNLNTG